MYTSKISIEECLEDIVFVWATRGKNQGLGASLSFLGGERYIGVGGNSRRGCYSGRCCSCWFWALGWGSTITNSPSNISTSMSTSDRMIVQHALPAFTSHPCSDTATTAAVVSTTTAAAATTTTTITIVGGDVVQFITIGSQSSNNLSKRGMHSNDRLCSFFADTRQLIEHTQRQRSRSTQREILVPKRLSLQFLLKFVEIDAWSIVIAVQPFLCVSMSQLQESQSSKLQIHLADGNKGCCGEIACMLGLG